jgi:DNA ligase-1
MNKLWHPMLAAKPDPAELDAAIAALKYPVLASPKLDGIRATVQNGKLLSRSLKLIPNLAMQKLWGRKEFEGLDGEIIVGSPFGEGVFDRTRRVVMARDRALEGNAVYRVFDKYHATDPFTHRLNFVAHLADPRSIEGIVHVVLGTEHQLLNYEKSKLRQGYEGICVRDPSGVYKQGRSTLREGGLIAIKRFVDAEAVILATYEQEENTNEKTVNELGRSKRSSSKAGKVGKDTLGGFTVVMLPRCRCHGIILPGSPALESCIHSFNIGIGALGTLTDARRKELWAKRKTLPGRIVKFRYQKIGTTVAPRIPCFLGFRDKADMS